VSKHHCGQTFSKYFGVWEGRSPVRRGCGAQPSDFFLMILCRFLKKNVLVLRDRILRNTEYQKTGSYVTGRPNCSGPSCREVKIDVWKYIQTIVMGLYAVCEQKLAHPDRVLSQKSIRERIKAKKRKGGKRRKKKGKGEKEMGKKGKRKGGGGGGLGGGGGGGVGGGPLWAKEGQN